MALLFTPNTYSGKAARQYTSKALLEGDTIRKQAVTVMPNIKTKTLLRLIDQEVVIQSEKCNFNPLGDTRVSERYLELIGMQVNFEICHKDLRQSWEADLLNPGRNNEEIPTDLGDFLRDYTIAKVSLGVDNLYWNGKSAGTTTVNGVSEVTYSSDLAYEGIIPKLLADTTSIRINIPSVTPANVFSVLSTVYSATPDQISNDGDLIYAVARNVGKSYALAQGNLQYGNTSNFSGVRAQDFLGFDLTVLNHLPPNTIVVYRRPNMYMGTDLLGDFNELQTLNMKTTTGDKKYRFMMDFAFDGEYAFGSEVVIASPSVVV